METSVGQVKPHNELDKLVRPSPFFLFLRIFSVHLLLAVGISLAVLMPSLFLRSVADIEILYNFKIVMILTLMMVGEIFTLVIIARWVTEFYVIKNDSLTYRMGIFFKQKRVLLIRQIVEVVMIQNLFGRIFNYGTIKVITSQALEGVYIKRVENPNKYFKVLRELSVKQQIEVKEKPPIASVAAATS
jgi:uncharacterized membrane protein YdbT with pleckstrin-like domain